MSAWTSMTRCRLRSVLGAMLLMAVTGVAYASTGTVTYVYTDPQGTPLAEADASGNITATYDYAPYGSQAMGTAPSGPGYTGHVNDPESGLVYMQARYYDPSVGRFLSVDPVGPAAADMFKFNRFAYVDNNPIIHADPDGRDPNTRIDVTANGSKKVINDAAKPKPDGGAGDEIRGKVSVPKSIVPSGGRYHTADQAHKAFGDAYVAKGVEEKSEYQTGIISLKGGGYDYIVPGAGPPLATIVDPTPLFNAIKGAGFMMVAWSHTHWDDNLMFSGGDMRFVARTGDPLYLTNRNDKSFLLNTHILNRAAAGHMGAEGVLQYISESKGIQGEPIK